MGGVSKRQHKAMIARILRDLRRKSGRHVLSRAQADMLAGSVLDTFVYSQRVADAAEVEAMRRDYQDKLQALRDTYSRVIDYEQSLKQRKILRDAIIPVDTTFGNSWRVSAGTPSRG